MTEKQLNEEFEHSFRHLILWRPPKAKFRSQDIFGLFDWIAMDRDGQVYFFQITTKPNAGARIRKIVSFCYDYLNRTPTSFHVAAWDVAASRWEITKIKHLTT